MAIKLGTAFGVPIYIDYSWFIIFGLVVYTVGFGLMPVSYPNLSLIEYLSIGILSAVVLFASIVVHELAHSIVARNNGLQIGKITLFLFGGVSEMEAEPLNANVELKVAAAGPLTSIAIGIISGGAWYLSLVTRAPAIVQSPLYYSFFVNVVVAAFNLIPAFPMDGGRVLRSLLWRGNKDVVKSTRTATTVGKVFAYLMMFIGIFTLFTADFFTGFWLLLIGWFISSGASSELTQTLVQRALANLRAEDVMTRYVDSVPPDMSVTDLSSDFLNRKNIGFAVMQNNELVGCVTIEDLKKFRRDEWSMKQVQDIMTPKEKLVTTKETDPANNVLSLMNKNRIGRVFVLDSYGRLAGVITRNDVIKTVQLEEPIFGSKAGLSPFAQGLVISVDQGMLFELEAQIDEGKDWSAMYDNSAFSLIDVRILQISNGGQAKQFAFQALRKGRFSITLLQGSQIAPSTQVGSMRQRQIRYTIVVN
ncbi:MAG: site-2 protease family protein [Thaumarchaeota archaeon]|nr:site-2 protease family protein [Nitrososphaerota archaeon]